MPDCLVDDGEEERVLARLDLLQPGLEGGAALGPCLEQPAEAAVASSAVGGLEQPVAMGGGRERLQPDIAPVEHLALGARARRPVLQVFAHEDSNPFDFAPGRSQKRADRFSTRWVGKMLQTVAAFDRLGEENAFAVLARATALAAAGQGHHQPRHRPARLQDAGPHRRGRDQGAARRPPRLHAGDRAAGDTRGGRAPHADDDRRRGVARERDDPAGRQADHVCGDRHVRRAGRRDHVSGPRLPDLPLDDRVHGRGAGADPGPRGERLCLLGRGDAGADHAEDEADHPELPGQPDRRRDAQGRDRQAGEGAGEAPRRRDPVGRDLRRHDL